MLAQKINRSLYKTYHLALQNDTRLLILILLCKISRDATEAISGIDTIEPEWMGSTSTFGAREITQRSHGDRNLYLILPGPLRRHATAGRYLAQTGPAFATTFFSAVLPWAGSLTAIPAAGCFTLAFRAGR